MLTTLGGAALIASPVHERMEGKMKVLTIEPCVVNFGDDRGGQHVDAGKVVDVTKETAVALTQFGRALYCDKDDDPKKGLRTASPEQVKAAGKAAKE